MLRIKSRFLTWPTRPCMVWPLPSGDLTLDQSPFCLPNASCRASSHFIKHTLFPISATGPLHIHFPWNSLQAAFCKLGSFAFSGLSLNAWRHFFSEQRRSIIVYLNIRYGTSTICNECIYRLSLSMASSPPSQSTGTLSVSYSPVFSMSKQRVVTP